jgi:hypothetical protein
MARSTPAQKPRGLANRILILSAIDCILGLLLEMTYYFIPDCPCIIRFIQDG